MEFNLSVIDRHNPYNIDIDKFVDQFYGFIQLNHLYDSALKQIETKLEIIDNEFQATFKRNPIHSIQSRLKSPQSIAQKLMDKGVAITVNSILDNLHDIAGVRVICHYIDDIYAIVKFLSFHDDIKLIKQKDYIKAPKPNGYRSFHLIVDVPVYLSTGKKSVPVEIQIRTIAMDFWASLEHQLHYKTENNISKDLAEQLRICAETINQTDVKMQDIYKQLSEIE